MDAAPQGPSQSARPWVGGIVVALLILGLDQASKWWIVQKVMVPPREIELTPFFNLVMVWNRGITFGLFGGTPDSGRWVLIGLSLAIVAILAVWMARTPRMWVAAALGGVIGGAIGNVVDRLYYGAVADFLDFHYAGWHWPAFNVADSAIVVGVCVLMLDAFIAPKE